MSSPETESQYFQPELPFPEGSLEHDTRVINEAVPEGQFAVSSIRDVLGAWKSHFRKRRNRTTAEPVAQSGQFQPELPFPEADQEPQTEVMDRTVSEEQTAVSSIKQVVQAWKSHLKDKQAKSEAFHDSLAAETSARLAGKKSTTEHVSPRTRAERRAEIKAEKAIYKHARAKEQERWKNAVHGTRRGAVAKGETRKARRDVIKAAKQLHKDGAIDGRELMKRITESAGILKFEESSSQKRARKNVDAAANRVYKKSSQPRLRKMVGSRLADTAAEPAQALQRPTETAPSQETAAPTERRDIPVVSEPSAPVEVKVHSRSELFPSSKAKSFKFDWRGKLISVEDPSVPKRAKSDRSKPERAGKKKPLESGIPKEALDLFDQSEIEASYDKIEDAIEAGKVARLAELNKGKSGGERIKTFPREELGEVVAKARRDEIEKMLGVNYSEENERILMSAFTAVHRERMRRQREEEGQDEA